MESIVFRRNNMFVINKNLITADNKKKDQICNALYAAMYAEFLGASEHPSYEKLTNFERIKALNVFAHDWLKSRGLI